jgi:PAS domain S-box-containing protein
MDPTRKMRALVIEDDSEMANLVAALLRRKFSIEAEIAPDCATAHRLLTAEDFDLITLDYRLPDGAGLDLLDEITESLEHPPVIMVTGYGDEETAARSFRSRASGYVVKDNRLPAMLSGAVEKALAEISLKRIEKELLDEKVFIEDALNNLPDLFIVLDIVGNLFRWNRRVAQATGFSDAELGSMNFIDLFRPEDAPALAEALRKMRDSGEPVRDVVLVPRADESRALEFYGRVLLNHDGVAIGFCGMAREITGRGGAPDEARRERERLETLLQERSAELEKARESIRMGEEQFSAIVGNSPDIIITFDRKGRFLHSNRASETILGYKPEEYAHRQIFELAHPDDRQPLIDAHRRILSEPGAVTSVECRFRHKDGTWRTLETYGQGFTTLEGEYRIIINARDITDRKTAEEQLREREQRLRMITNNMRDVIIQTDTGGITTYISPSFQALLGHDPEEFLGKSVFEFMALLHPDDREYVTEATREGLKHFEPSNATFRVTRADGSELWMETIGVPLRDDSDNLVGGVVTCRDVTKRRRAEEQVRKSEEKYRSIFNLSPDFVYLVDRDGYIVDANEALLEATGMSIEQLRETNFMYFVVGENEDTIIAAVDSLWDGQDVRGLELGAETAKGAAFLEINATPLTEGGSVKHILSLARDITQRKHIENELRRLNNELEGYARTVSHDLRTPITTVKLAGEHLARAWEKRDEIADLGAEIERIAKVIGVSASQAEILIKDLLALALAGQEPEVLEEVDVGATVQRIVDEQVSIIEGRGAVVRAEGDLGKVRANPTHIYQLFTNLIDNAIKHNDKPRPEVEIIYRGNGPGGHIYVVKDNGPGIPPGEIKNVFMPFVKGTNGYTGIGLAIVDKIIKLYGGTVKVYGNGGSSFEFSIKNR